ncbi:MAG: hypothetical protein GWN99_10030 [Gemmatimonadetes bacterium]|uniref:Uncharacterized protein n=1 Tax=Candidatus Kutchimonas denitrificans TaxID=3056748 RepID=A0AAE4Z5S1_9BACT|nr:hypothetical protein [Gemmatimonadota bacterium]NIR74330.1 hypothetical protein [Candidatus Kutchimonas denitrificans]NIS01386.1 hypothetical protein [Gemmatimonadota bacterium]NIU52782.1 hypothetical protein [Gemmatimonadota bacterium]NIY43765.1 hypothetical protein [Gemmatimonadota bacterium]
MRSLVIMLAASFFVIAALPTSVGAQDCHNCKNVGLCEQDCDYPKSSGGDRCEIEYVYWPECPGQVYRVCNWVGDCGIKEVMLTPTKLTPAGTYLAVQDAIVRGEHVIVTKCDGYIVTHEDDRTLPVRETGYGIALREPQTIRI